ncbi:MAG: alpha/beta hydrolase [Micromonosporaceae bacterium]
MTQTNISSSSAPAGVITTGLDVAAETRAFNEELMSQLANQPALYEATDQAAAIEAARAGSFTGVPRPRLPHAGDRTVASAAGPVAVRILVPDRVTGVYLHLHGGGHTLGSAAANDGSLWELACRTNMATVSVDYRLAPEHPYPAAPDDAERAALWLAEHARSEFGTDRLAVGGDSAGAHLAVVALLRLRDRHEISGAYRAAYLNSGSYDMSMTPSARQIGDGPLLVNAPLLRWFRQQFLPGLSGEELRDPDISPLFADLTGMPLARFVAGTQDHAIDDAMFMAARWRAAGSPAQLEIVAEAVHGFTLFPITIAQRELERQYAFLNAA